MSWIWTCNNEENTVLSSMHYVLRKDALWKIEEMRKTQSTWWFWETEASFCPFGSARLWKPSTDKEHCPGNFTPLVSQDQRQVPRFPQMLIRNHCFLAHPQCLPGRASRQALLLIPTGRIRSQQSTLGTESGGLYTHLRTQFPGPWLARSLSLWKQY